MNHRSHERWTDTEDADLIRQFRNGTYPVEIARRLGRTELAIRGRLAKYRLLPPATLQDIEAFRANRGIGKNEEDVQKLPDVQSPSDQPIIENDRVKFQATLDVQQAFRRFHFVYGIVNPTGQVYVGYSQDVWHRIGQHNRDMGAVKTRNR